MSGLDMAMCFLLPCSGFIGLLIIGFMVYLIEFLVRDRELRTRKQRLIKNLDKEIKKDEINGNNNRK